MIVNAAPMSSSLFIYIGCLKGGFDPWAGKSIGNHAVEASTIISIDVVGALDVIETVSKLRFPRFFR
jgi:hypothetical protein